MKLSIYLNSESHDDIIAKQKKGWWGFLAPPIKIVSSILINKDHFLSS